MTKAKSKPTQTDTVSVRTEKDKRDLVAQLRKTPIVQLACERVGVSRSTYYRWRAEDNVFARAADHALEAGKFFINDLAESKLMQMVQGSNITAIIFWLKNNHPSYTQRTIHEHDLTCPRKSTEEEHRGGRIFADILAHRGESVEEMAKRLEWESRNEEEDAEEDRRLNEYDED